LSGIADIVFAVTNRKEMKQWGWSLAFGIINIVFGVILVASPGLTLLLLTLFVGFAILFRSIAGIILSIKMKKTRYSKWGWLLTLSILGIIAALFLIIHPLIVGLMVIVFTGIALIAGGIFSIGLSLLLRKLNFHKKEFDREMIEEDWVSWFKEED
jgi:uncharacterized membrane protein HdeD (DUF308 family)